MKKLLLALFLLLPSLAAQAQQSKVVATCGTVPRASSGVDAVPDHRCQR